jgi:hypothetical protein
MGGVLSLVNVTYSESNFLFLGSMTVSTEYSLVSRCLAASGGKTGTNHGGKSQSIFTIRKTNKAHVVPLPVVLGTLVGLMYPNSISYALVCRTWISQYHTSH